MESIFSPLAKEKTSIQIYKSDLPRINILRHQIHPRAMSQPELVSYLLDSFHDTEANLPTHAKNQHVVVAEQGNPS